MFVLSFVANMIKRHPKCLKLISRKSLKNQAMTKDPYIEEEQDPLESRASKSCLWEVEIIMKQHYHKKVRDFAKIFKTDLMKKTSFFKSEDYTVTDALDLLKMDIEDIDDVKEGKSFRTNLLVKNKQMVDEEKTLKKRTKDSLDINYDYQQGYKRVKYGEQFAENPELFDLHD